MTFLYLSRHQIHSNVRRLVVPGTASSFPNHYHHHPRHSQVFQWYLSLNQCDPHRQPQPEQRHFQTCSKLFQKDHDIFTIKQTRKEEELESSTKAWIPPMRPLSGDKGQSHLYERNTKKESTIQINSFSTDMDDAIQKDNEQDLIRRGEDNKQQVHYIDLDELDLQELQKLGYIENQDIYDEDLDHLIEDLKNGVFDDDDEEEDYEEEDDEEEEYDEEDCNDKEEEHLASSSSSSSSSTAKGNDQYQHLFESIDTHESVHESPKMTSTDTAPIIPDWLKTRRQKLQRLQTGEMMTPSQSTSHIQKQGEIPIIPYTLLSSDEIMTCLKNLGGNTVQLIVPERHLKQYLGWEGMILATATSYSHIRVLADTIVRALRERKLSERGVIGAQFGAEGGEDPTMSARKKSKLGRGSKIDDGWMAVDCRNYIVHIQDDITRKSVDLEGLWSPGSKQGKELRQLDCKDDDAVDDYVAENPVPSEYSETLIVSTDFWGDGKYRGGMGNPVGVKRGKGRWTSPRDERRKSKNRGRRLL